MYKIIQVIYLAVDCLCAEAMNQHDALLQIKPIQQYALFYDTYIFFDVIYMLMMKEKLLNVFIPTIIHHHHHHHHHQHCNNFPLENDTFLVQSSKNN